MRWSSLVTLLCSAAALVLTFLVLFAGSSRSFLQNTEVLTLNMSRLGHTGDLLQTLENDSGGLLNSIISSADNAADSVLDQIATDIASALNIPDFYDVHIMNYCQGEYEPNATLAVYGEHVSKNTTFCSPTQAGFHFNLTEIVEKALPDQISLGDINWPSAINDAEKLVRSASLAAFILYVCAIVFIFLALVGAVFGFFTSGRLSACCNLLIDFIAFLCIGAASGVATAIIVEAVKELNKYGNDLGISATRGTRFLAMTWAATGVMLIALIISFVQLCVGRRDHGGKYISSRREKNLAN